MGLLSDLFSFLIDITDDGYSAVSERWFDNVWEKMYRPNCAEGCLEVRDGKLYKKFRVSFRDGTCLVITDENDDGRELRYVNLNSEQKKQLLRDGYVTIREYD